MKTEIIKIKGDWQEVVDDCRATVAKPPLGREPGEEWKTNILIAEHEPIRDIWVKWKWRGIKYWIAMHWKTHIWPSRVNTQRSDRTGGGARQEAAGRASGLYRRRERAALDRHHAQTAVRMCIEGDAGVCRGFQGRIVGRAAGAFGRACAQLRVPLRMPGDAHLRNVDSVCGLVQV